MSRIVIAILIYHRHKSIGLLNINLISSSSLIWTRGNILWKPKSYLDSSLWYVFYFPFFFLSYFLIFRSVLFVNHPFLCTFLVQRQSLNLYKTIIKFVDLYTLMFSLTKVPGSHFSQLRLSSRSRHGLHRKASSIIMCYIVIEEKKCRPDHRQNTSRTTGSRYSISYPDI
jgi:hypothetical protein